MNREPLAARLLAQIKEAQGALLVQSRPAPGVPEGLAAVYQCVAAAVDGMDETALLASPSAGEWSIAEVLEHMAEHDRHYVEIESRGTIHYVEHGLEHALQVWGLRRDRPIAEGPGEPASATLD